MKKSFSQNTSFLNIPCNCQDLCFLEECAYSSFLKKVVLNAYLYHIWNHTFGKTRRGREIAKAAKVQSISKTFISIHREKSHSCWCWLFTWHRYDLLTWMNTKCLKMVLSEEWTESSSWRSPWAPLVHENILIYVPLPAMTRH